MLKRLVSTAAVVAAAACSRQPTDGGPALNPRRVDGLVDAQATISADRSSAILEARVRNEPADSVFWAFRSPPDSAFVVSLAHLERLSDGVVISESSPPGWLFINFSPDVRTFTPLRRGMTGTLTLPLIDRNGQPLPPGEYRARIRVVIYGVTETKRQVSHEFGAVSESDVNFVLP